MKIVPRKGPWCVSFIVCVCFSVSIIGMLFMFPLVLLACLSLHTWPWHLSHCLSNLPTFFPPLLVSLIHIYTPTHPFSRPLLCIHHLLLYRFSTFLLVAFLISLKNNNALQLARSRYSYVFFSMKFDFIVPRSLTGRERHKNQMKMGFVDFIENLPKNIMCTH